MTAGEAATTDRNKAVVQRVFDEVINQRRLETIDEIYVPDVVDHDPLPGAPPGIEGVKYTLRGLFAGLPDLHVTVEEMSAHLDKVVVHNTWQGTRSGKLLGLPASNRPMTYSGIVVWRVQDGRIAERWAMTELVSKLGVPQRRRRSYPGFIGADEEVVPFSMLRPILPDKLEQWRQLGEQLLGPRREEHRASRKRLGIEAEMTWHQSTSAGDVEILYLEVHDVAHAFSGLARSQEPFDRWLREQVFDIHGVDLAQVTAGRLPVELGFTWSAR
jgi:steroid delta-isomerase-like uncharacterized protein